MLEKYIITKSFSKLLFICSFLRFYWRYCHFINELYLLWKSRSLTPSGTFFVTCVSTRTRERASRLKKENNRLPATCLWNCLRDRTEDLFHVFREEMIVSFIGRSWTSLPSSKDLSDRKTGSSGDSVCVCVCVGTCELAERQSELQVSWFGFQWPSLLVHSFNAIGERNNCSHDRVLTGRLRSILYLYKMTVTFEWLNLFYTVHDIAHRCAWKIYYIMYARCVACVGVWRIISSLRRMLLVSLPKRFNNLLTVYEQLLHVVRKYCW